MKTFTLQPGEEISFEVVRPIAVKQTAFQYVEILETRTFGPAVFINGKPQSSAVDYFIFNEALIHPALVSHPDPRRVFIAGGGPGSCLREVLRHRTVDEVVLCDIDADAVSLYRQFLGAWHGEAFNDPRVRLVHADAREFLERHDGQYDCLVVDVPDPLDGSTTSQLFSQEFYKLAQARLGTSGVLVTQAGRLNINNLSYHRSVLGTIQSVFSAVFSYGVHVPFYAECWGFVLASARYDPTAITPVAINEILQRRGCIGRRFYDGAVHAGLFALPSCLREELARPGPVSRDDRPLTVN